MTLRYLAHHALILLSLGFIAGILIFGQKP